MNNNKIIAGFSLVELSVVLVIAGLVVAAITGGSHLLQAAKLDKIISEISGYVTATNNFKDKYKAWPGDMANATSFWGTYNSSTNPNGTTNGNGNEGITWTAEVLPAWQQLSLSGMIAGAYTGIIAPSGNNYQAGVNMPPSSAAKSESYYMLVYWTSIFGTSGNFLQLGSSRSANQPWDGALTSADAHIIDTKIDDGLASAGNFYSIRGDTYRLIATACVDQDYALASGNYILTDNTAASCRTLYWLNKL